MQGIANNTLVTAIDLYQRFISPHKGYCCAHRVYHGRSSCSAWGKRVLKKHGIFMFYPLMRKRFNSCQMAYEKIKEEESKNKGKGSGSENYPCVGDIGGSCLAAMPCTW